MVFLSDIIADPMLRYQNDFRRKSFRDLIIHPTLKLSLFKLKHLWKNKEYLLVNKEISHAGLRRVGNQEVLTPQQVFLWYGPHHESNIFPCMGLKGGICCKSARVGLYGVLKGLLEVFSLVFIYFHFSWVI